MRGGRLTKWKGKAASYAPNVAHLVSSVSRAWGARLVPAALLVGLAAGPAAAETLYWDPNGPLTGRGGSGTWNTTSNFWSGNPDGVCSDPCDPWNNGTFDDAVFGDANTGTGFTGTVTLGTPITVQNMTFENDSLSPFVETNYTFNGNTLTLGDSAPGGAVPTITVDGNANDEVTINSVIAGADGFAKDGGGILRLNGANTFTGTIDHNAGQLIVNGDAALGDAATSSTSRMVCVLEARGRSAPTGSSTCPARARLYSSTPARAPPASARRGSGGRVGLPSEPMWR